MSDYIIKVENLGKKYKIRHQQERQKYVAMRDIIAEKASAPLRWLAEQKAKSQARKLLTDTASVGYQTNGAAILTNDLSAHAFTDVQSESSSSQSEIRNPQSEASLESKIENPKSEIPLPLTPYSSALTPSSEDFWALKDVSFEVKQGEVLGIIGRNGAGKSTLLKILSRITKPTEGQVLIRGRVASLLEVGTGFHPELTGRENIFLNGAVLGMTREEIKKQFDEIVEFAEVETFLDTPVKRYSSGMYVRLAFAIAAHLEPDILIVDEVLAVGDLEFQKKSLGKIGEVAKGGRTVLFVSHQLGMISKLCEKGILLSNGKLVNCGLIERVVQEYLAWGRGKDANCFMRNCAATTNDGIWIDKAGTFNKNHEATIEFGHNESISLLLQVGRDLTCPLLLDHVIVTVALEDRLQRRIFTSEYSLSSLDLVATAFTEIALKMTIRMPLLVPGQYQFIITLHTYEGKIFDRLTGACEFAVRDTGSALAKYEGFDNGCIFAPTVWEICSEAFGPTFNQRLQ